MGGRVIFALKKDCAKNCEIQRHKAIEQIIKGLPKYASRCHKKQSQKLLSLTMHEKVSPEQFRTIYKEFTGDCSVSNNKISKNMDKRIQLIFSISDNSVLRDLRVNNHRNSFFDDFL